MNTFGNSHAQSREKEVTRKVPKDKTCYPPTAGFTAV